jgi:hypothetical protein
VVGGVGGDLGDGAAPRFSFTAYERGQPFKHDFVAAPVADGTRVERTVDGPEPTGFLRVI